MSVAVRAPRKLNWKSPWLFAVAGVVVGVAATLGFGFGFGLLAPGRPGGSTVATSPTPSSSASSPSPGASPSASPSVTPSTGPSVLSTLRGTIAISNGTPTAGSGGWITFPGGVFATDPASNVRLPALGDYYDEAYGLTQVKGSNAWVPVPRNAVSPDGTKYAYYDGSVFHVVSAGAPDLLLRAPVVTNPIARWGVLESENTGLFVRCTQRYCASDGVWWLTYSGSIETVASSGYWTAADGKYAYGTVSNSMNEHSVMRLDLSTGARTTIFNVQDMHLTAVGVAADGRAVVLAIRWESATSSKPVIAQIWLAGAGQSTKIYETAITQNDAGGFTVFSVVADTMGTWIATSSGLYLFSAKAGLEFASPVAGPLGSAFRS